jgi:hypothetical protein
VSCGLDCQLAVVLLPVTVNVQCCWDAPGQLITYLPGWRVSEKPPDRPGVRFSCSPRILDRSEVRSSASDTALASWLATLKSTDPALMLAGLGAHPWGVSATLTVAEVASAAAALEPDEPELEQPASNAASAAAAATAASGSQARLRLVLPDIRGLLRVSSRPGRARQGNPRGPCRCSFSE